MKSSSTLQCTLILVALAISSASAEVKLPAIFGDHMVLQEGKTIPVWGSASPGEKIVVIIDKDKAKTKADVQGKWRVDLKPIRANTTPTTLTVAGVNSITFTDVLIGDVWLSSGQSNMEFGINMASTGEEAIKAANQPLIRLFTVPRFTAAYPQSEINSTHTTLHDTDLAALQGKWQICTPETLAADGTWGGFSAVAYFFGRDIQKFTGQPVGIINSTFGGSPAEAWVSLSALRKDIGLAPFVEQHEKLLAKYDATMAAYPTSMAAYKMKEAQWERTDNPSNEAALEKWADDVKAAKVAGQIEPPSPKLINKPTMPDPSGGHGEPSTLFNGMIAPILPYALKGVIWYQGESNGSRGKQYQILFPRLVEDWRERWGEGDFPFLYVQLPPFHDQWSTLREAQLKTLSVPNTGMAVAIDVGGSDSLHPAYKEVVGDRLAILAEHVAYDKDFVYSGPLYKSMKVENNAIRISFDQVGSGLTIGDSPVHAKDVTILPSDRLLTFTIAGEDKHWYTAEAKIDHGEIIVSSPQVPHPVAVRYGWDVSPVCNLYNKEGLPASPFRTDDW